MSKQVKELICKELAHLFDGVDAVMVVDPTKLDGLTANALRREMAGAKVQMQLVKNSLTKRVVAGTKLEPVSQLLAGPCALAWGGDSIVDVAKLLVGKLKALPKLVIKGAVMEGVTLGPEQATALSKMPTKAELKATLVSMALAPGSRLAGAILAPGAKIASIIKGRIEALEKAGGPSEGTPAAA